MSTEGDAVQRKLLLELLPAALDNTRLGIVITQWDEPTGSYRIRSFQHSGIRSLEFT